jgi:phage/plasmid-associated DNA primase
MEDPSDHESQHESDGENEAAATAAQIEELESFTELASFRTMVSELTGKLRGNTMRPNVPGTVHVISIPGYMSAVYLTSEQMVKMIPGYIQMIGRQNGLSEKKLPKRICLQETPDPTCSNVYIDLDIVFDLAKLARRIPGSETGELLKSTTKRLAKEMHREFGAAFVVAACAYFAKQHIDFQNGADCRAPVTNITFGVLERRETTVKDGFAKRGIHAICLFGMPKTAKREIMHAVIEMLTNDPDSAFSRYVTDYCAGAPATDEQYSETFRARLHTASAKIIDVGAVAAPVPLLGSRKAGGQSDYVYTHKLIVNLRDGPVTEDPADVVLGTEMRSINGFDDAAVLAMSINNVSESAVIPVGHRGVQSQYRADITAADTIRTCMTIISEHTRKHPSLVNLYEAVRQLPARVFALDHERRFHLICAIHGEIKKIPEIQEGEPRIQIGTAFMYAYVYTALSEMRDDTVAAKTFDELKQKFREAEQQNRAQSYSLSSIQNWLRVEDPERFNIFSASSLHIRENEITRTLANTTVASEVALAELIYAIIGDKFRCKRTANKYELYKYSDADGMSAYKWMLVDDETLRLSIVDRGFSIAKTVNDLREHMIARLTAPQTAAPEDETGRAPARARKVAIPPALKRKFEISIMKSRNVVQQFKDRAVLNTPADFAPLLDQDPLAIGVRNGVLKFDVDAAGVWTVRLIGRSLDPPYVSKSTAAAYNPALTWASASVQDVMKRLGDILDDEELRYLLRVRSMLFDATKCNAKLIQLFGAGCDGKSTIMVLHANMAGALFTSCGGDLSYSVRPSSAIFGAPSDNANSHTAGYMMLKGARYAYVSDPNEESTMRGKPAITAAALKTLITMGELGSFRGAHDRVPESFGITAQFEMATNIVIRIPSMNYGTSRRIGVIPFKHRFVTAEEYASLNDPSFRVKDPTISTGWTHKQEVLDAYLWILVQTFLEIRNKGWHDIDQIPQPVSIAKFTENYMLNSNTFEQFIRAKLVRLTPEEAARPEFAGGISMQLVVSEYQTFVSALISRDEMCSALAVYDRFRHHTSVAKYVTGEVFQDSKLDGYRTAGAGAPAGNPTNVLAGAPTPIPATAAAVTK